MGDQPRFKVRTIEGWLDLPMGDRSRRSGVSAHVLDTACAHNVVDTFRSEDYRGTFNEVAKARAVMLAQMRAEALNAAECQSEPAYA